MRLLLVDDDDGFRALLRTTFEAVAVEVSEASDASEAALAIRNERPDVVVLDVGMPGIDGIVFCRMLKADPETRDIGVVLLTGRDDVDDLGGADALLLKPFRPLELLAVVERVAGGHGAVTPRMVPGQPQSGEEQLLLYARDLRDLIELERGQRALLENAYLQTVSALEQRARDEGHADAPALAAGSALCDRARPADRASPRRGSVSRIRLPPPRHRQDRDSRTRSWASRARSATSNGG